MRKAILLIGIILLLASCQTKQVALTQADVEKTILALEHQWLDRWAAGDPFGCAEACADDVTYYDDVAAQTRIDGREELRTYLTSFVGQIPPHTYELVDAKVQMYGDIAIATFHYQPIVDGAAIPAWKASDVYRLADGQWKLVHLHWSTVEEPR